MGIDINPDCKSCHKGRVEVEIGSQDDTNQTDCFGSDTMFDIIIDDGSHVNSLTISTFDLRKHFTLIFCCNNLIFIIEDLGCFYLVRCSVFVYHNVLERHGRSFQESVQSSLGIDESVNLDNNREDLDTFFRKEDLRIGSYERRYIVDSVLVYDMHYFKSLKYTYLQTIHYKYSTLTCPTV